MNPSDAQYPHAVPSTPPYTNDWSENVNTLANSDEVLQWLHDSSNKEDDPMNTEGYGQTTIDEQITKLLADGTLVANGSSSIFQTSLGSLQPSVEELSPRRLNNSSGSLSGSGSLHSSLEEITNKRIKTEPTTINAQSMTRQQYPQQQMYQQNVYHDPMQQQQAQRYPSQPQPPQQPQSPPLAMNPQAMITHRYMEELFMVIRTIGSKLERIQSEQKAVPLPIKPNDFASLEALENEVKSIMEHASAEMNKLFDNFVFDSVDFSKMLQLQQDLYLQMKQLEVFMNEFQGFRQDAPLPSLALVIISQPFPDSVKQHKPIDEPVIVKLITGAKVEFKPNPIVVAEILNFNAKNSKKHVIGVENAEKPLNQNGMAIFNDLKFPNGTRLKSVRLKFVTKFNITDARGNIHTMALESNPTNPIVVKTNENQWHEAEGILLKKTAFNGQMEITWKRFANWLQRHYLTATRQSVTAPSVRPLTSYDLDYLHKLKFEGKPVISQNDFDKFWEWFGPLLHKIRYQRHLCNLWTRGYICGFLKREEVDAVLKNEEPGTFLVRCSESRDQFAVSYQSTHEVKHYLVKSDDTHGAKKTLPDFLRDQKDLQTVLQLSTDRVTEKRTLRRCDKDTVLREFYSKKVPSSGKFGYDDTISVND